MSRHSFDSRVAERNEFETTINNRHAFESTVKSQNFFEVVLDGFLVSTSWIARFASNSGINIGMIHSITKITGSFLDVSQAGVNRLLISDRINPKFSFISENVFSVLMRMAKNMGLAGFYSQNFASVRMVDIVKIKSTNGSIVTNSFGSSPVFKKYYVLTDWDASNLSVLDTKTLEEMDYQVV